MSPIATSLPALQDSNYLAQEDFIIRRGTYPRLSDIYHACGLLMTSNKGMPFAMKIPPEARPVEIHRGPNSL